MHAVVFEVDMKQGWEGDADAELDQVVELTKSAPGFVHGTWSSDGTTGLSVIVMESEEAAKAMIDAGPRIPPDASVTFRSVNILEVARDV
jgi:hypothetical protein